ncbi:hypothetical protein [Labilibaculum antarcticum]|nr:hypothetical protein [Labilibaculum antarcticum]
MIKLKSKYLLICLAIMLLTQCNYRTSSQKRFSKTLDIEIPKNVEILKDEYQDMWQDFAIIYEIKLSEKQMSDLTHSIRSSKYFNPRVFVTDYVQQDMFLDHGDLKAVWAKTDSGYIFQNDFKRDAYSAKIDTVNLTAKFNESHD